MSATDPQEEYAIRGLNSHRLQAISRHAGDRVLDVGCGSGAYVNYLAPSVDIHGVDYAEFDSWKRNPDRFRVARVQNLPYADNSFDTVTAFEVLEHIDDVPAALGELRRVAKHNVILTVPNCTVTPGMKASGLIYHHWYDPTHVNFWSTEQFAEVVAGAGFHVEAVNNINAINLGHLVMESLGLKGWLAKAGQRLFKAVQRPYKMTTLVVARIN